MLSSDPRQHDAAPVASYAFQQLDAPPPGSAEDIADVLSAVRAEADRIREEARAAGLEVIMDRCILKEHRKMLAR